MLLQNIFLVNLLIYLFEFQVCKYAWPELTFVYEKQEQVLKNKLQLDKILFKIWNDLFKKTKGFHRILPPLTPTPQ